MSLPQSKQGQGEKEKRGQGKSFSSSPFLLVSSSETPTEKSTAQNKARPFTPWPLPGAVFLILGVLMSYQDLPWFGMILATVTLGIIFLLATPTRFLLPLVLLIPLGFARFTLWEAQPNSLLPLVGKEQVYSGISDGKILTLDNPKGAKVMVSSQDPLKGKVTLKGEIDLPQGKRNPGGFDFAAYLRRNGIWGQIYVKEVIAQETLPLSIKERLQQAVTAGLPEREAALAEAINLGIRNDLGELRDIFATSGLAHILALSGLNIAILVAVLGFVLKPLGLWRYPLLILLIIGFLSVVEQSPSVFRAGVMACIILVSLWRGAGRIEIWPTLGLSVIFCLLWNPSWLFDISFQLSYLAVIGLMIFVQPISKRFVSQDLPFWHWKKLIVEASIVSLAAQLTTLPLIASSFGSVPTLSVVINITAVPLASLIAPLGFLVMILGLVSVPLAALVNQGMAWLYKALILQAQLGSSLPNLTWGEVSPLGYGLFYIGCLAFALMIWGRLKPYRALLVMLTAGLCSAVNIPEHPAPEIIFLDIGQGDSTLIRLPGRKEILMDGGGTPFSTFDPGKRIVVPALKALGIDELEMVIASHADADHIEGLISVLELMKVQTLVIGVEALEAPIFKALINIAKRKNIKIIQVRRGESLTLGDARLDILNPPSQPFEENNWNSVTFVLNYKSVPKALLMGDMPIEVESTIAFPQVDIVMAGHHGSKGSTSEALLRATRPKIIVLSYGRNNYGHPHQELMQRIKATGAEILETHHSGAVRLPLE
jgi:competence protein ComEC